MAEKTDSTKTAPVKAEAENSDHNKAPRRQVENGPVQQTVRLDDSQVAAVYANFCRISGTPEELILDFAFNTQPSGVMPDVLPLNQRVIVNFFTAKRLLGALQMAVHRHEATFGVLETDIRKRVTIDTQQRAARNQPG